MAQCQHARPRIVPTPQRPRAAPLRGTEGAVVSDNGAHLLEGETNLVAAKVPGLTGRFLRWLMRPASLWLGIPLALLLIVGGIVGFLLLLAQDVPFLRRPAQQFLAWAERKRSDRRGCADCRK